MDAATALSLQENAYRSLLRALIARGDLTSEVEALMTQAQTLLQISEDRHLELLEEVNDTAPAMTVSHAPPHPVPRAVPAAYDGYGVAPIKTQPRKHDPHALVGGTVERHMPHLGSWAVGRIVQYDEASQMHHVEYHTVLDADNQMYNDYHHLDKPDPQMRNLQPGGMRVGNGGRPAPLSLLSPPGSAVPKSGGSKQRRPGGNSVFGGVSTPNAAASVSLIKASKTARRVDSYPSAAQLKKSGHQELVLMLTDLTKREREIYAELYDMGYDEHDSMFEDDDIGRLQLQWERMDRREYEIMQQLETGF